jgi:murein L,D-transpeptidase YcbB/YkuD
LHHPQHKQRQHQHKGAGRHSRLAGQQHHNEHSHSSTLGSRLAGLFRSKGSSSSNTPSTQNPADFRADSVDAAAVTADMLESGGSLTFAQHMRQQEAAAASAAATAAATLTPPAEGPNSNSSTSQQAYSSSALADALSAGVPAGRIMSALPVSSAAGLSPAQTGQLNEDIFSGELGGVGNGGGDARSRTQSVTLAAMSRGKRRWQNAAQKIVAMQHITSSYRPGALQASVKDVISLLLAAVLTRGGREGVLYMYVRGLEALITSSGA